MDSHRVVFVIFPGFQILDLSGPHEVFVQANRLAPGYELETVAGTVGSVRASGGLGITPDATIDEFAGGRIDTLVVVGGPGRTQACADRRLIDWIAAATTRSGRVAAVCSGAFLLAEAGLLDGRRAVTHWGSCAELARRYPAVTVEPDPIFVNADGVWTSAGVTAGIDLALALVEQDRGAETSRAIARSLVMFVQRPGGQSQFSTQLAAQRPVHDPLRQVQVWIADHLTEDLSVPALANRAGMSERHFARTFTAQTGQTPAAYVESVRVEAARRLLESTDVPVGAIARGCGFGTVETLHRRFKRTIGVTPGQYRHHFA
ncbi:GlxA family transcriptional regulator [Plantactinospora sp. S1510]|uniref:GlxA family transcriptional regulator n=1 Tax=Plantactinospora alkalitolerans TaxID=2789879 RepID=A0ABS0H1Y0_9ACTN|nr:GlxA family transcriptional regulator [Plantactinospora alkalitolerans]MBF9132359.1 GlxA family transcriptional regulator [Plantactinospora alkalitolerans]